MTTIKGKTLGASAARIGVVLAVIFGASGCGEGVTPILITLVGENPDAEAIELHPQLDGQPGEGRVVSLRERQLVLQLPAGRGGKLRLEAEAISSTLVGCTMGNTSTEVYVEPVYTRAIPVEIDLNQMERSKCPLVVECVDVNVSANAQGIDCERAWQAALPARARMTLSAAMGPPGTTVVWTGDCSGTQSSCEVQMTQARRVEVQQGAELRPKMIPLAPGTFQMGSPLTEKARKADEVQHEVTIQTAFRMSETEVTQRQYVQVMGVANPSYFTGDLDRPVESVSWFDAVTYCNRLSMQEGLPQCYQINGMDVKWNQRQKCRGYRLPTEAEWEYAARYGSPEYVYAGSDSIGDVAWYDVNSSDTTHVVRSLARNRAGLYDLSGNVWEWVWDWYGAYPAGGIVDYTGPESGSLRVVRGGSWILDARHARVANRVIVDPGYRFVYQSFRLARSSP